MTERHYEYIVVGKGLMGAAAARHLTAHSPGVALIGPDEPPGRAAHTGVFGSHYDEGRITRILDPDRIWALLAQRSIARYRDIEKHSGIAYYHEVGHLAVGPRGAPHPVCGGRRPVADRLPPRPVPACRRDADGDALDPRVALRTGRGAHLRAALAGAVTRRRA